ncbi:MAG: NIPSNAP family protein [Acidimicrobiia bacterium]|nr:NIPSNAP family protein [Acidimicrobiia bacterium]
MADLVDAQMQLAGDADYQSLAATVSDLWAAPAEILMNRVVATTGELSEPKPLIQATRATIAMGHVTEATARATEILEHVTKVTGHGGMLATSTAGAMFQVTWIIGYDSAADLDTASEAAAADADYAAMVDKAGGLFVDGSAERFIMMQMP